MPAALMRRSIIARNVSTASSSSRVGVVSIAHTACAIAQRGLVVAPAVRRLVALVGAHDRLEQR